MQVYLSQLWLSFLANLTFYNNCEFISRNYDFSHNYDFSLQLWVQISQYRLFFLQLWIINPIRREKLLTFTLPHLLQLKKICNYLFYCTFFLVPETVFHKLGFNWQNSAHKWQRHSKSWIADKNMKHNDKQGFFLGPSWIKKLHLSIHMTFQRGPEENGEGVWECDVRGDALPLRPFPPSHVRNFSFVKFPSGLHSSIRAWLWDGGRGCSALWSVLYMFQ